MTSTPPSRLLNTSEVRRLNAADTFKGIFVVNVIIKKTDKNGKPYWEITVSDQHGILNARVWADAGWWDRSTAELETKPDILSESAVCELKGKTVGITGRVSDYKGQTQFSFNAISLLNQEKFPATQYIPHSGIPLPVLSQRLDSIIDSCGEEMRAFLRMVFSGERGRMFRDAPAAVSNHHAYAHGLLEHSITVTDSARAMASTYLNLYPTLDMDVVTAGALLHDLGKIEAYTMSPVPEITLQGAVLDHIALGYASFMKLAEEANLNSHITTQIAHILLSHHGQKEFGSPVLPATLEALIVSAADELDFRLFCWGDAVKDLLPGQNISQFHFAAQRRFWRVGE